MHCIIGRNEAKNISIAHKYLNLKSIRKFLCRCTLLARETLGTLIALHISVDHFLLSRLYILELRILDIKRSFEVNLSIEL